jgi:ABC-type branched-subunit amino acid transport system permease subunit/ABC-type branched-subunit amino acid transport system ATPase component
MMRGTPAANFLMPVLLAAAAIAPLLGLSDYYTHLLMLMVIFGIFAMSLDILMGYGGLPSLGHAAFFGLGAYGVGIAAVKLGLPWWQGLILGLGACAGVGALFGLVALRTKDLYFMLITLALGQLLWGAANRWGSFTGGFNGLAGIKPPAAWLASTEAFYYVGLALLVLLALAMKRLVDSPFGLALRALSDSESRMQALGYNVWLHKYATFIITGVLAGIAGALNALYNGFVSPRDLSISMSAECILMVILGGTRTLWGPLIGAIVVVTLRNVLSIYFDDWLIVLGAIFIAVVLFAPDGIIGRLEWRSEASDDANDTPADARALSSDASGEVLPPGDGETALAVDGIGKSFGGMLAVRDATFKLNRGERVVLLGPNGAGKTTLFHVITGSLPATTGSISLFGRDLGGMPTHRRARLGIARTFQITNLFPRSTVADHLRLCAISKFGLRFNMWRHAGRIAAVESFVECELKRSGLWSFRNRIVRSLSYGHQRQLEVAMAVAMAPKMLLLDEPAAGLSKAETGPIVETLRKLDRSITVLLVEHDMDVAFAIADRIIVFNHGELVAEGSPAQVRLNPEVNRIYLGRRHA